MILSIIIYCLFQIKAQEIFAPTRRYLDDDYEKYRDGMDVVQLHQLFTRSIGIVNDLPDKAFSASHVLSTDYLPHYARIGKYSDSTSWVGKIGKTNALTLDLTTSFLVTGVATQGRYHSPQWVEAYKVDTSENGYDWTSHGSFVGNFDAATVCQVRFDKPVLARFVKFTVLEYNVHNSMRVDVLIYETDD